MIDLKYAKENLSIYKNRDFNLEFQLLNNNKEPIDLTGFDITSSIRVDQNQSSELIVNFTVVVNDPVNGKFSISLNETETNVNQTYGFYDIVININNYYETYIFGAVTFIENQTQIPSLPFVQVIAPKNLHSNLFDIDTNGHNANVIILQTATFNGILNEFLDTSTIDLQTVVNYIDQYVSTSNDSILSTLSNYATTHTHNNITLLNSLSDISGELLYVGSTIAEISDITLATIKATLVDDDSFSLIDSVGSVLKRTTWSNLKSLLKAYFDPIYAAIQSGFIKGQMDVVTAYVATNGGTISVDYSLGNAFTIDASALGVGGAFTVTVTNWPTTGTRYGAIEIKLLTGVNIPTISWTNIVTDEPILGASEHKIMVLTSWDAGVNVSVIEGYNYVAT